MSTWGADAEQLDRVACLMENAAAMLNNTRAALESHVRHTAWTGPEGDHFRHEWNAVHAPILARASVFLADARASLSDNASQQRGASAAGTAALGVMASVGGASLAANLQHSSTPKPHRSLLNRVGHWTTEFGAGVVDGPKGIAATTVALGKAVWDVSPVRAVVDPQGWSHSVAHGVSGAGTLIQLAVRHPGAFAADLIDLKQWKSDPAKAIGELVPGIVLAVASGGVGGAAAAAGEEADSLAVVSLAAEASGDEALATAAAELATADAERAAVESGIKTAMDVSEHGEGVVDIVQAADGDPSHVIDGDVVGGIAGDEASGAVEDAVLGIE